jgi:hypothetical protein
MLLRLIAAIGVNRIIRRKREERQGRRALSLLSSCPDGCTEGVFHAYGFTSDLVTKLIHEGWATTGIQRPCAAKSIEIRRVKITEDGMREL